ncbi:uncharacterized protein MYCFIDRAFT_204915 [Pseudocercospora fijiensis CIRAD86]|uniref:Cytochrome P450 monooxygenase n=1 Tax=Pseudocercospora fijiensis (strain CIRAD86) TaxID=383855 RepID=M3A532_PSEFD|nr:uncharacterized protein MYCFIDRAFT_204915 [Pseudocercospora fijiensis CIRAD86]EME79716.1 hypothetical protein MYCFIDRAFT_204915 [Pseudocercospora fijiensis CIRAD86]
MVEESRLWQSLAEGVFHVQREIIYGVLVLILGLFWIVSSLRARGTHFESINEKKSQWWNLNYKARKDYIQHARRLLSDGFRQFKGPFSILTDGGRIIMLPPEMIDAVNEKSELSFQRFTEEHFLAKYDTFRTFRSPPPGLFEEAVMTGLTRSLPKFTKALSKEMSSCLDDTWNPILSDNEWHEIDIRKDILKWVARLSTRIFLPSHFAEDPEWLRVSVEFTTDAFMASTICRFMPRIIQWPMERFFPLCRKVRRDYRTAASILQPVLDERHKEISTAQQEGRKPNLPDDAIEWFRNASHGTKKYHEVDIQLSLSVAAIHTTSDLLLQALLNLGTHPELLNPLREEAISVLKKHGWQKTALHDLHLLDSFLKETQRLKPINMVTMHRTATSPVHLSNGLKISQGARTAISSHKMWSASIYADPETFNAYRFLDPTMGHRRHLVATSPEHLGFAHGKHACPGRFFAANEVKIAMVHLVLKFDFKLEDAGMARWVEYGTAMIANPKAKMWVKRRRDGGIDLEGLAM